MYVPAQIAKDTFGISTKIVLIIPWEVPVATFMHSHVQFQITQYMDLPVGPGIILAALSIQIPTDT